MNKGGRTLTKGRLGHQASAGGRGACIIRTLTPSLATVRFRGSKANKLTVCGFDVSMDESFPFGRTGIYNAAILHEACCSCHRLESRPYEARWYMTTELSAQPLLLIVCIWNAYYSSLLPSAAFMFASFRLACRSIRSFSVPPLPNSM